MQICMFLMIYLEINREYLRGKLKNTISYSIGKDWNMSNMDFLYIVIQHDILIFEGVSRSTLILYFNEKTMRL